MTNVLIKREKCACTHAHREKAMWRWRQGSGWCFHKLRKASDCQQMPGESPGTDPPSTSEGIHPATPCFRLMAPLTSRMVRGLCLSHSVRDTLLCSCSKPLQGAQVWWRAGLSILSVKWWSKWRKKERVEGRKREPKDREPGMLQPAGSQSDTTKRLNSNKNNSIYFKCDSIKAFKSDLMCLYSISHTLCILSHRLFVTLWTVARQPPLSMGFSVKGYWSGLPCPPPGGLSNPGIEPSAPSL